MRLRLLILQSVLFEELWKTETLLQFCFRSKPCLILLFLIRCAKKFVTVLVSSLVFDENLMLWIKAASINNRDPVNWWRTDAILEKMSEFPLLTCPAWRLKCRQMLTKLLFKWMIIIASLVISRYFRCGKMPSSNYKFFLNQWVEQNELHGLVLYSKYLINNAIGYGLSKNIFE